MLETSKTIETKIGSYPLLVTFKIPTPVEAEGITTDTKDTEIVKMFVTGIESESLGITTGGELINTPGALGAVREVALAVIKSMILEPEEKN